MDTNIDKEEFNRKYQTYLNFTDLNQANRYYNRHLHQDILTIINNVLYHWDFDSEQLTREDTEADLLFHLLYKKGNGSLTNYSGNLYNVVFTILMNKFRDICRSHKLREEKIQQLKEKAFEMFGVEVIEMDDQDED